MRQVIRTKPLTGPAYEKLTKIAELDRRATCLMAIDVAGTGMLGTNDFPAAALVR